MSTRNNHSRLGFVAAAVVAGMLVAACAGNSGASSDVATLNEGRPSSPPEGGSAPALDEDAQALVFAGCMRDNGVDMPDPAPGRQGLTDALTSVAGDLDRATLRRAIDACQNVLPQYAQEEEHTQEDMLEFAECLREQGLEVSDSPFEDLHSGDIDEQEFVAAMEVCREQLVGGDH